MCQNIDIYCYYFGIYICIDNPETDEDKKHFYLKQKRYQLINFEEEEDFNDNFNNDDYNNLSNYDKVILECEQWNKCFQFLRYIECLIINKIYF